MTATAPLQHLGEIDVETFLRDYWQQKPCLFRAAFKDFVEVISPDELAGMACDEEVESRLLITDPNSGQFELRHGPFDESQFSELPASHWSLLVQGVDHWIPEAADLVEQFRFIPSWRLDDLMISYSTPEGGVGPHYDNYDVFIIQAQGRRRWEIGGRYTEQQAEFLPDQPIRILKHWHPEQSWELEPGDMIYIPPRVGHNGVSLSDDCVNYSVGYRAPHAHELLRHLAGFCEHHSADELRFSDSTLGIRSNPGEITDADLRQVRQLLLPILEDQQQLRRWWGELVTEPKDPQLDHSAEPISADELGTALAQPGQVRRSEGIRFAFSCDTNHCYLFVDGEQHRLGTNELALVKLLCNQNSYDNSQLAEQLQQPAAAELIALLFERGQLYLD
ncbi:cupin domain-containing protein [Motiliproteus coralliicola]|uniref:Cupin domain-containing protein n=1 Tax=Motiliproteus coralliicola TaxID=2283196 RepID=A0A369WU82_9GAMM|nr:cupin domain-containing protein [Motiliproteus coralliicola]RDE23065.1 cupin domain-containing protein [Motiliproteus coralliicola]